MNFTKTDLDQATMQERYRIMGILGLPSARGSNLVHQCIHGGMTVQQADAHMKAGNERGARHPEGATAAPGSVLAGGEADVGASWDKAFAGTMEAKGEIAASWDKAFGVQPAGGER